MKKELTIKNNSKSRRGFLQDLAKWVGGTAVLAATANVLSPIKAKAADGPDSTAVGAEPMLGGMGMVGFNFAPRGWAFCDGQLLPINNYQALFSLLGTIYGGDGRTTFALPDLRGRAAIHEGQGPGLPDFRLGQRGGSATNTLVANNLPSHTHTLRVNSNGGNSDNPTNNSVASNSEGINQYLSDAPNADAHPNSIANTGGSQPFNNMPPYLVINFVIALVGIFPSRN